MPKRINSKNKRLKSAVSEVVGTFLLLTISVTLFSVVYIAFFSIQPSTPSPSSNIIASMEKDKIIFEHRSGESLSLDTKILLSFGGVDYPFTIKNLTSQFGEQFFVDSNGDSLWSIGEKLVVTKQMLDFITNNKDLEGLQAEATVIDVNSNSIIMEGVLKKGSKVEIPYVITKPVVYITNHLAQLSMNYNFKDYNGTLRFLYKTLDGDWIVAGVSTNNSGWGTYTCIISNLNPNTVYYFKAQLEYNSIVVDGEVLQFKTLGIIVGEWHFDSGSGITAVDSSGHENHGTLYNQPQWTTDKVNGSYALSFDGIDDYVLVSDSDSLDLTSNISIEAWIKPLNHSDGLFGDIADTYVNSLALGILDCQEHSIINIYNNIYAIVLRGTDNKGFLVTVEINTNGQINNKIIDDLIFDSSLCYKPKIIKIDNTNYYIIVYTGSSNHAFLKTVEINDNGLIADNVVDSLEFDTNTCYDPFIIHIADYVYAIAYTGYRSNGYLVTMNITDNGQINGIINSSIFDQTTTTAYAAREFEIIHLNDDIYVICYRNKDNDGELRTVRIQNDGTISNEYHTYPEGYYINTFLFDRDDGWTPDIIHINGNIFAIAYGGFESPSQDGWLKTVNISNDGKNFSVVDSFEYDETFGIDQNIIHVYGNIYAVVYRGPNNDGFIKTIEILNNGDIGNSVIDTWEFDPSDCYKPRIINIDGNIYAIVYTSTYNDGYIRTFSLSNDGTIIKSVIDHLEFGIFDYLDPNIIHVKNNVYAVVYRDNLYKHGYLRTYEINSDGQINEDVIDILEFENVACYEPNITYIGGSVYAIVYRGPDNDGFVVTVEISDTGQITDNIIDIFEFDTSNCYRPKIIQIAGSFYAISYTGPSNRGYLKTVEISNTGIITKTVIDNLVFSNQASYTPEIIQVFNDVFAIVYSRTTSGGYISTVKINGSGSIDDNIYDTLRFDDINNPVANDYYCYEPDIIQINDRIIGVVYRGRYYAYLKTLRIGENGDITNENDDTYKFVTLYYQPNIIQVSNDIYAVTCGTSIYDGYLITVTITQTQKVGRVIEKAGAYKIYANSTTVFAYINSMQIQATISQGFNYVVLTYNKNKASNNLKLYVNTTEAVITTFSESINVNSNDLYIGGLNCVIDEVFIHELELNKSEIIQRYNDYVG
ncbi:MAG: type IV pilin N-terminal domain-containing protein [Candidatus Thermoplasmatota archaeon]|nr:type IV pilin N-terminal domain-containing protein [Candidatus Thermoplasmatota archaeon]